MERIVGQGNQLFITQVCTGKGCLFAAQVWPKLTSPSNPVVTRPQALSSDLATAANQMRSPGAMRRHVPPQGPPLPLLATPLTHCPRRLSPRLRKSSQPLGVAPPPAGGPAPAIRAPGLPRPAGHSGGAGAAPCAMTWAGVRGDGPRPCYSAERPRLDDAARIAEPRAELGNGRGDRPGRPCPRWRASLSPFAALPGECGGRRRAWAAGGPVVFMLLCRCRRLLLSRNPLPGVGAGARGGRGRRGNNSGAEAGAGRGGVGLRDLGTLRYQPAGPPPRAPPACPLASSSRGSCLRGGRRKWSGRVGGKF